MQLAITLGDPVGIGPEIVAKFVGPRVCAAPFVVVGDVGVLRHTAAALGLGLAVREVASVPICARTNSVPSSGTAKHPARWRENC